jgi:hypothetical protein
MSCGSDWRVRGRSHANVRFGRCAPKARRPIEYEGHVKRIFGGQLETEFGKKAAYRWARSSGCSYSVEAVCEIANKHRRRPEIVLRYGSGDGMLQCHSGIIAKVGARSQSALHHLTQPWTSRLRLITAAVCAAQTHAT